MISVVIPSILEDSIFETLNSINKSLKQPKEIIIVIPKDLNDPLKLNYLKKYRKVIVLRCEQKGQVFQRIMGFKYATQKYVLQMDADITLKKDTISVLCNFIENQKRNVCVSGFIYNKNDSTIKKDFFNKYFNYFIFHGNSEPKPGTISSIGIPFSLGKKDFKTNAHQVDWLQGGLIMHKKSNLIKENYFNFTGPAYCEDLFHSIILRNNNIKLFILRNAVCYHHEKKIKHLRLNFYKEYIIRLKFLSFIGSRKYFVFTIWFIIYMFKINMNTFLK